MSRSRRADGRTAGPHSQPAAPIRPPDVSCAWTTHIEWGRRDGHAGFMVSARRATGEDPIILAETPELDWPPSGQESFAALTSAVRTLEASLLAAGWRPIAPGTAWYAKRFEWQPEDDVAAGPGPPQLRLVQTAPPAHEPAGAPAEDPESARAPRTFARTPAWPEGARALWRCEIAWSAGWSESRFEAVMYRPAGRRGRAIGASSPAKWLLMRQPDAEAAEMRSAVQRLASSLVARGWSPAGMGLNWYSQRFLWRREGAPPDDTDPVAPGPSGER